MTLDNGPGLCEAWVCGDNTACLIITAIGGCAKTKATLPGTGQEVQPRRGVLSLKGPTDHGQGASWVFVVPRWSHICLHGLGTESCVQLDMLAEVAIEAMLAGCTAARATGFIMDSRARFTPKIPVLQGCCPPHVISWLSIAGRAIMKNFPWLLMGSGYSVMSVCHLNPAQEMAGEVAGAPWKYTLPDRNIIEVHTQHLQASGAWPRTLPPSPPSPPSCCSIHNMTFGRKCDLEVCGCLYRGLLLSRDSSSHQEVQSPKAARCPAPQGMPRSRFCVWIHASHLTYPSPSSQLWEIVGAHDELGSFRHLSSPRNKDFKATST
ncbi:actin, cytoplasmic 1-like [Dugong dugon]